jgi:tripartite-type tricarboxylate transporter receptor subunit TctC
MRCATCIGPAARGAQPLQTAAHCRQTMNPNPLPSGRRRRLLGAALAGLFAVRAPAQLGTDRRAIRLIALEAGAQIDTVARLFAPTLGRLLGRDLVIENHGGVGGRIAARLVATAPPDGDTLGIGGANNLVMAGLLKRDVGYDPNKDFTFIAALARVPFALGVRRDLGVASVAALVERARSQPGVLTYGSAGVGGSSHLALAAFEYHFQARMLHVPFRSSGLATQEMIAGRIDVVATDLARLLPLEQAGKVLILAVTGAQRARSRPHLPTLAEAGMKDFHLEPWYGLYGPAALPEELSARLEAAVAEASRDPDLNQRVAATGFELLPPTRAALLALIAGDRRRYAELFERLELDRKL